MTCSFLGWEVSGGVVVLGPGCTILRDNSGNISHFGKGHHFNQDKITYSGVSLLSRTAWRHSWEYAGIF